MREVDAEVVEHRRPAGLHLAPELVLPVGAGPVGAADDSHDARPARASLHEELGGEWRDVGARMTHERRPILLVRDAPRRLERRDRPLGRAIGPHVELHGAALTRVQFGREHPGADAVGAGDRVPDLLGCGRDGELELEAVGGVGRGHDSSSVLFDGCDGSSGVVSSAGTGCDATTRRCGRPSSRW